MELTDQRLPVTVSLLAWSPFIPRNADDSSLPAAAMEYSFTNNTADTVDAVFSYSGINVMCERIGWNPVPQGRVFSVNNGFVMSRPATDEEPWQQGAFQVTAEGGEVYVNTAWYRGGWFDAFTMNWNDIQKGCLVNRSHADDEPSGEGGNLSIPLTLAPGESRTITLRFIWYVPESNLREGSTDWTPPEGWFSEPHHNTYDIEFWGPDGMCSSIYLAALEGLRADLR